MSAGAPSVAVQGDPGCFSHAAALGVFGDVELIPCRDFPSLFAAVNDGRADRGVVPVENALAGAVSENLDLLVRSSLYAVAEAYQPIEMCLTTRPGTRLEQLTAVGSHPVALQQCRRFFAAHPTIRPIVAYDTAGSIRDLMADRSDYDGAIGPALAADLYGAEILERGIADHRRNFTRFLIVAREREVTSLENRPSKASLAFTLPHEPGALHAALGIFANHGVDLTRLESRPIPGCPWEYRFHADVRGGRKGARTLAIDALREMAGELRVIGEYEEADAPIGAPSRPSKAVEFLRPTRPPSA